MPGALKRTVVEALPSATGILRGSKVTALRVAAIHDPDHAETHAAIEAHHRLHQRPFDARVRSALARPRGRPAVVGDERIERERRAGGDGPLRGAFDLDRRRIVRLAELAGAAAILLIRAGVDLPDRHQRAVRLLGLAVARQRPDQILLAPVLRHAHREDVLLAPRIEVRRLSLIDAARLERVVRADRHVDLLLVVPVHVAEDHVEAAVGVALPAFEHGDDVLAGGVADLRGRHGRRRNRRDAETAKIKNIFLCDLCGLRGFFRSGCHGWLVLFAFSALRAATSALNSSSLIV